MCVCVCVCVTLKSHTDRYDLLFSVDMDLFAPLESDIDESANSVPELQVGRSLCIHYFLSLISS